MPFVLTAVPGTVTCGHTLLAVTGAVAATGSARLLVDSTGVLTATGVASKPIAGCPTPSSQGNVPCTSAATVTAGGATKLLVDSAPVLLPTLKGTTNGQVGGTTPQTLLTGAAKQSRLGTV